MFTADEIRNTRFSKSGLSGYKVADVDEFRDLVADDYEKLEKSNEDLVEKIKVLAAHVKKLQENEESVKTCLINAQISADKVLREADEKSKAIIAESEDKANYLLEEAQSKSEYLMSEAKTQSEEYINNAKEKADSIVAQAEQEAISLRNETDKKVNVQKNFYAKLKSEIENFREDTIANYSKQLELLEEISESEVLLDKAVNSDTTDEDFNEKFVNDEPLPKKEEKEVQEEYSEIDDIKPEEDEEEQNSSSLFEYQQ